MKPIFLDTNHSFQRKAFRIFLLAYGIASLLAIPFVFSSDSTDFEGAWLAGLTFEWKAIEANCMSSDQNVAGSKITITS